MSEDQMADALRTRKRGLGLSPVWLIPLAIVLIGGWLVYQNLISHGATVILEADTAAGLKAGKTPVKVHDVKVGAVESVRLSDDYSGAIIELRMNPGTGALLASDSKFWVVKPRIGRRGISGLSTILSGAYVQLRPGQSAVRAYRFEMLDQPPVASSDAIGVSIVLFSNGRTAVNVGDPIVYQGQQVGRVETAQYQVQVDRMRYGAFIKRPFAGLITENTQFWSRSGIDFQLTSQGVRVQMESLETILSGGLTFGVPEGLPAGESVDNGATFVIYASRNAARQERFDRAIEYVALFEGSVRGLNAGAPVEFKGIRVGTVEQVPFFREQFQFVRFNTFKIPVLISFEPQRLGSAWSDRTMQEWRDTLQELFRQGLRASVRPGNLLTGAMFIDLHFIAQHADYEPVTLGNYPVFPSRRSGLADITHKVNTLLTSLNNLSLGKTVSALNQALSTSNEVLMQMKQTLASVNAALTSESVRELPRELYETLNDLQTTLASFHKAQPTFENINQVLRRLSGLLEDLTPLARMLRRNPDALLFGRDAAPDPVPEATP